MASLSMVLKKLIVQHSTKKGVKKQNEKTGITLSPTCQQSRNRQHDWNESHRDELTGKSGKT